MGPLLIYRARAVVAVLRGECDEVGRSTKQGVGASGPGRLLRRQRESCCGLRCVRSQRVELIRVFRQAGFEDVRDHALAVCGPHHFGPRGWPWFAPAPLQILSRLLPVSGAAGTVPDWQSC